MEVGVGGLLPTEAAPVGEHKGVPVCTGSRCVRRGGKPGREIDNVGEVLGVARGCADMQAGLRVDQQGR